MSTLHTATADLEYDDVGAGPPMLLVHGFSCARTDYTAMVEHFATRHRVIAFDQRGHGGSSLARDERYGFTVDVADARELCEHLGIERPIIVGHSLGGVTAMTLAAAPGFANSLVLLDSTIELPDDVQIELETFLGQLSSMTGDAYREVVRGYARHRMIDPGDDAAIAAELVERTAALNQDVYVRGAGSILDVDVRGTALSIVVPTLFIASSLPWIDMARVHELRPTWFLGRTVGAGHFHHVLVPEQVNAMVERFLATVANGQVEAAQTPY